MFRLTPVVRITLALVMLTTTIVLSADMLNLIPDPSQIVLDTRKKVCESLAIYGTLSVQREDIDSLQTTMQVFVHRNADVLFATLRQTDGTVLARAGYLAKSPIGPNTEQKRSDIVSVPIFMDEQQWGAVEIHFKPLYSAGLIGIWEKPIVKLTAFFISLGFFTYLFFMRKVLQYLDPSSAIPERVKAALDALAEGVVVLDGKERIVMANAAFAEKVGQSADSLMGQKASSLKWTLPNSSKPPEDYPWLKAMRENKHSTGTALMFKTKDKGVLTFMVNGAPVSDGKGKSRGALATFDDVTQIEQKNDQLQKMLKMLKKSSNKVQVQNQKLQVLATQDPLTRCLNRRAFFKIFQAEISRARRYGHNLSCAMVDIDFFKAINDNYGHLTGDHVLQKVSKTLRSALRKSDFICRYGGEEFCVLLPHIDVEQSKMAVERFRFLIESSPFGEISVTASFGVTSMEFDGDKPEPEKMIDQADKALYTAKDSGRNCLVHFKQLGDDSIGEASDNAPQPVISGIAHAESNEAQSGAPV
jgi:diguanylate cyclase (GGDEF)-like protein/PAS domain S-box-containing protein